MVIAALTCLLALAAPGPGPGDGDPREVDPGPSRAVAPALGKASYPWYDPRKDAIRPIALPRDPSPPRVDPSTLARLGNVISIVGLLLALGALIGLLVWFWRIYEPSGEEPAPPKNGRGGPSRVEALPEGMLGEFESSDPWEDALRRRARGDLSGAVVCLFAHQLLTLSRLGLVRLAPGRTGRQMVRAVADVEFRGLVDPTLRRFEAVYYGHRAPSTEEFDAVWSVAEAFERRVARGVVA